MKDLKLFLVFIIGFAIGIIVASLFSDLLRPYFPKVLKPEKEVIEGKVTAKEMNQGKLLFTVAAPQGAILVTFSEKLSEIDLLIEEEDMITLGLHQYEPFVSDPTIRRVVKLEQQNEAAVSRPTPDDASSPFEPETGGLSDEPEEENSTEDSISF